jgi:crotonobetainyl-CoA:carnitine CoA-transferase CaiB-like acyl-CoA transferase
MTQLPTSASPAVSNLPLKGVRILDFTWVWAGPLISLGFGDMGADVIKVESSSRPDPFRTRGEERSVGDDRLERSPVFARLNRSKRSIGLNLRDQRGKDLALRLAGSADLVLENYRAGTLDRLGLGFSALVKQNPQVVLMSLCGGGQTGRWANMKSFAFIASALAGYESQISYPGEDPIGGPTVGIGDPIGSAYGFLGAMAGLHYARRTGHGLHVDVSNIEAMISLMSSDVVLAQAGSDSRTNRGTVRLAIRCGNQDRWVSVVLSDDQMLARMLTVVGAEERPAALEALRTPATLALLESQLTQWAETREAAIIAGVLQAVQVDAFEVKTFAEARTGEHAPSYYSTAHPVIGDVTVYGSPWGVGAPRSPAPRLGQDTDSILLELGLDQGEIGKLRSEGTVE